MSLYPIMIIPVGEGYTLSDEGKPMIVIVHSMLSLNQLFTLLSRLRGWESVDRYKLVYNGKVLVPGSILGNFSMGRLGMRNGACVGLSVRPPPLQLQRQTVIIKGQNGRTVAFSRYQFNRRQ
ncbi:hypothetical protein ScPMuIL_002463 [Solemya velum]